MSKPNLIDVPMNRVEGDLEVRAELDGHAVVDAWSSGTMYRGFETLLRGRGAMDGLVITPRVCGICSTAQLLAAVKALDAMSGTVPPADAIRIRNLTLMTEHLQSDARQAFLSFASDFANPAFASLPGYEEAVRRFAPFRGETALEVIRETRRVVEIIAILGGQWPHSSYMVPGGVTATPSLDDLLQCGHLLKGYRTWYERRVLGCPIERWREVRSAGDLERWLEEAPSHRDGDLGFFIRFARAMGLDRIGRGHECFLSFGQLDIPPGSAVAGHTGGPGQLFPAGFAQGLRVEPFAQEQITEHVAFSWYEDYEGGRHPFEGKTRPAAPQEDGTKYSWSKAPRYDGRPCETGPLAERVVAGHPLFLDLLSQQGATAFLRQLARIVRSAELLPAMETWLSEVAPDGTSYLPSPAIENGEAYGLTNASRGALGHWVRVEDAKIAQYQIITPTAWNGSPRDGDGIRGPWEEALLGTAVKDPDNPVELGLVVRSFDPCLVCTVHVLRPRGMGT